MRSTLTELKPNSRASRISRSVSGTDWMRFTASCTRGRKSWMPRLQRLKPTLASRAACRRDGARVELDRIFAVRILRELEVAAEFSISRSISSEVRNVGVPPPKCSCSPRDPGRTAALQLDLAVQAVR